MTTLTWAKLHGATTHFPIALVLCAAAFDGAGWLLASRPCHRELQAAGYWTILIAAIGSVGAVGSGLRMTKGGLLGHGALRSHHLLAWPAFASLIALATWRVAIGRQMSRRTTAVYVVAVGVAAVLVLGAAYWGGELMLKA